MKDVDFPGGTEAKDLPANARDAGDSGSIPGSGGPPGESILASENIKFLK